MASESIPQSPSDWEEDIVITGFGTIAPTGHSVSDHLQTLLAGKSAVRLLVQTKGETTNQWLAASIDNFDPKEHVQPRKSIKVMCREIQLAFAASMQAAKHAGIAAGTVDPDRIGAVFSGELIQSDLADVEDIVKRCSPQGIMDHSQWAPQAMENMYPLWMLRSLPNMAACHVGIALDARGPNNTITTEGTSSLNAIIEAINVIRRGQADVMLIGSSASRIGSSRMIQRYEEDFSTAVQDESRACKPFDVQRDGTVPSEISSALVVERRRHALARGATPLATIVSWASTFNQPIRKRWSGIATATQATLELLLERSRLEATQIDHINASAMGTREGDAAEASGIARVLPSTPVAAYKGAFGDAGSGTGLLEYISAIAAMREGAIPQTTNCREPASDCPINIILKDPKTRSQNYFVKLSNSPDGRCAGMVTHVD